MNTENSAPLHPVERCLVALDRPPWSAFLRFGLGWLILPAFLAVCGPEFHSGSFPLFFLTILVALRLVPGLLRTLLPFSREVKTIWAERRLLSKRFDSYQWRKLFWIGLGLTCYMGYASRCFMTSVGLAAFSLVGGGIGWWIWRHKSLTDA